MTQALQLHVPADTGNDNVTVHGVWWGYLDPTSDGVEALTNPVSSSSSSRRDDGRRVVGAEEGAGGVGALGVDLTSDAEQAKIASRAERFGTTRTGPIGTDLIPSDELAEIKARAEREARFGEGDGGEGAGSVQMQEPRAPRREVDKSIKRRRNVLHVYGADNMSVRDIRTYFRGFEVKGMRWLDGSSGNVEFADEFTAKNALFFEVHG